MCAVQHELEEDPGKPTRDNTSKPIASPLTPTRDNKSKQSSTNSFEESDIENEIFLADDHSSILTDNFPLKDNPDEKGNKPEDKEQNGNLENIKPSLTETYDNDVFLPQILR